MGASVGFVNVLRPPTLRIRLPRRAMVVPSVSCSFYAVWTLNATRAWLGGTARPQNQTRKQAS
jgi:hypothetical protein